MNAVRLRALAVFVILAYGLAWLVALPLYFTGGVGNPWLPVVAVAMMATPTIAALVVSRFVERPASIPRDLGLWPLRPARRLLAYLGLALLLPIVVVVLGLPIAAAFGLYHPDFTFSGLKAIVDQQAASAGVDISIPIGALVAAQLASLIPGAIINTIPALGEELGWRGYLLPRLMPLGTVPALVISGVLWGAWHTPLLLLGYNYPTAPGWLAVVMMCGSCILMGGILGWLRLRSNSIWPAALGHGTFNAVASIGILFSTAGETLDTTQVTILGWTGWIAPLVVVVIFLATRSFRAPKAEQTAELPASGS